MFVFTDGYGTCGLRLSRALQQAEEHEIDVVGIAVGMDTFFVPMCYQYWITAALPSALPEALRTLYCDDETNENAAKKQNSNWSSLQIMAANSDTDLETIWKQRSKTFPDLLQQLSDERDMEFKVQIGQGLDDLVVDICFVLDMSASMTPYLGKIKQH
jgi:hypothetical protein